jgi:hypothetical protein
MVKPVNPAKMPNKLPPMVEMKTNNIALIIVPNAPATAAFQSY